jgi:hypothetical protein
LVANVVAQAVHEAHRNVQFRDDVKLAASQSELTLQVRKPAPDQLSYMQGILAKPEDAPSYHRRERNYARRVLQLHESPDQVEVLLQAFRVGDLGICAIPFEVLVEIGLELKTTSPFDQTFVISHANGHYGYLPTARQHELGGYETWLGTNLVEIDAAAKIVDRLLSLFRSID